MESIFEATIEEFEQGAWVADLVSLDKFDGSFDLGGDTWTGTMVTERQEDEKYFTRVIGGNNKLSELIDDKYYSGSVSVQAAVQDICRACGETFGSAQVGKFLTTFERIRMPAYAALDAIADTFSLKWWIGRDGKLVMKDKRDVGKEAQGISVSSDVDASVELVDPVGVTLGGTYDEKTIAHIRWKLTKERFAAQIYGVPFLFRAPTQTKYDRLYSAKVDKDNGDGTIDVIADGRFGVTKVKLFCGVPGSKVKVNGGEEVTLGFLGGDPQKPYCVSFAQNSAATKEVGRKGDEVTVSLSAANMTTLATLLVCTAPGSPPTTVPGTVPSIKGTITEGSQRLKVGD